MAEALRPGREAPVATKGHARYLLLEQGLGAGVLNVALNAAIAWALFRGLATVPLFGVRSIAGDTLATCFALPFFTCLIVTRLALREVSRGRLAPSVRRRETIAVLRGLPGSTSPRAALFGGLGALLVAPVAVGLLVHFGVFELPFRDFVAWKALFAGGLAALVTPVIALAALADARHPDP